MGRPALGTYYDRGHVAVDVQPMGPGNLWEYFGCIMEDAIDWPQPDVTRKEAPDPGRAGKFTFVGNIPGAGQNATTTITLRRNKANALQGLNCPFNLRRRYYCAGRPDDTQNWESMDMLCYVRITSLGLSAGAVMQSDQVGGEEITIPIGLTAGDLIMYIAPIAGTRVQADLVARQINKVRYCDAGSCGDCGDLPSDGCSIWHAVTDADGGIYDSPYWVTYDGRQLPGHQWSIVPIDAFQIGEDAFDFWCIGNQIIVISPQGGFAYSEDGGDTWVAVPGMVVAHGPRALYVSGREAWAAGDGGYLYKSNDAGVTWNVEDDGDTTAQDLVAIAGYGLEAIFAVGDANTVVRTRNGGTTWTLLAGPSAGDDLTAVAVPRQNHVYVGNDVGELWHSRDYGATWEPVALATGGTGTIREITFCDGCGGQFGFLIHEKVTGGSDVYRTLDGGASWQRITDMPPQAGLRSVACCDHSNGVAVGDLYAGFGMIVELEAA